VRVEYESNIYRLFGFFEKNNLVILTNAYQKKSNKTSKSEIKLAEKYKKEYLKNKIKGN
jgi:phage-related protein